MKPIVLTPGRALVDNRANRPPVYLDGYCDAHRNTQIEATGAELRSECNLEAPT